MQVPAKLRLKRIAQIAAHLYMFVLCDALARAHFQSEVQDRGLPAKPGSTESTESSDLPGSAKPTVDDQPPNQRTDGRANQRPTQRPVQGTVQPPIQRQTQRPIQKPDENLETAPHDPDASEFMAAPYGQLGRWSTPSQAPLTRGFSLNRRLQITVLPTYASLRLPFIARPLPIRGGGAALEIDFRLLRWLWLRAQTGHTLHPVQEEAQIDEEEKEAKILAKSGLISATHAGMSLVYAMDTGRVMPMIDVGLDAMWIRSPEAAQNGQLGGKCNKGNQCEVGLSCRSQDRTCQPQVLGQVHAGIGLDYLVATHWSVGIHVRYFARIQKPSEFPVYLLASARAAFRF